MGWEDIESMPTANLREELLSLLNKELEYALPPDESGGCADPSLEVEAIRRNVCQWNYECVDFFLLDRDVVYMSMHYFDRYLTRQAANEEAKRPSVTLSHLLALSSLYVACKLHGTAPDSSSFDSCSPPSSPVGPKPRLRLQDFCNMSRGTYCPDMIEEMELSLLSNLQWKLHPPTPTDFLIRFVKILSLALNEDVYDQCTNVNTEIDTVGRGWSVFEVARYQLELAVYSPELCQKFTPSKVAMAAILNAMDSKIVKTKRTVISSRIRHLFLQHLKLLGGGFTHMDVEGNDMIQARSILKTLCSKTIVLPGQQVAVEQEEAPPAAAADVTFTPIAEEQKSFEYELPEVQSSSISPVSVLADTF